MTCDKCKYWFRFDNGTQGDCNHPKLLYKDDYNLDPSKPNDCLVYSDAEGYAASFTTGEKFGCIHFTKKD